MRISRRYVFVWLVGVSIALIILLTSYSEPDCLNLKTITSNLSSTTVFGLEFTYLINNKCRKKSAIKTIQIVTSFAGNIEARSSLRRAYPKEELEKLGIFRVFLLAMLKPGVGEVTQNAILHENIRYNDIVQGNFHEDYRNLTYKHIMGIRWAVTECDADYIIKMDDDTVVDMYSLVKLIDSRKETKYDILGYVFNGMRPIREKDNMYGKWFVTKGEYEYDTYPTYVSGWLYVVKRNAAKKLLVPLPSERFFWIDDVFVTGILAQKVNLNFEDISEYFMTDPGYFRTNPQYFECCLRYGVKCGFIVGTSDGDYSVNIDFQKHSKMCFKMKCTKNIKCYNLLGPRQIPLQI